MLTHAWIIPLIPALSFVAILAIGKRLPRGGSEIGGSDGVGEFDLDRDGGAVGGFDDEVDFVVGVLGAQVHHQWRRRCLTLRLSIT